MIKRFTATFLAVIMTLFVVGCDLGSMPSKKTSSSSSKISSETDLGEATGETDTSESLSGSDESVSQSGSGSDESEGESESESDTDESESISESESDTDESESVSESESDTDESESESESGSDVPEEPEVVHPSTAGFKKILFLGNSHAMDTFMGLPEIFRAEGYTDYTFGLAYYGQQDLQNHAEYISTNADAYEYRLSLPTYTNAKIIRSIGTGKTFGEILADQDWDIVILQVCMRDIVFTDTVYAEARQTIVNYIHTNKPNAKIGTSTSWLAPYADDPNTEIPEKWANIPPAYDQKSGGTTPAAHFGRHCSTMINNILDDDTYYINISLGTAVYYANQILGIPSGNVKNDVSVLYRDVAHMSVYGRMIVSYSFFAQFMGQELTEVNLVKPSAFPANGTYSDKTNVPDLTDAQKSVIIESANVAFNHPWVVPTQIAQ